MGVGEVLQRVLWAWNQPCGALKEHAGELGYAAGLGGGKV